MGLLATAAADLLGIVTYDGEDITVISPSGGEEDFMALTQDIYLTVDPGTGEIVSGRQCTVAIPISSLIEKSMGGIKGVAKTSEKPWVVKWTGVNSVSVTLKVIDSYPDQGIGMMVCRLEAYRGA